MTDKVAIEELVRRLRNTPNWQRESYGSWKDCVLTYDRAPFEAADMLEALAASPVVQGEPAATINVKDFPLGRAVSLVSLDKGSYSLPIGRHKLYASPLPQVDALDGARYREFFKSGLPVTFLGETFYDKEACDKAIDAAMKQGSN